MNIHLQHCGISALPALLLLVGCAGPLSLQKVAMESMVPPGPVHVLTSEANGAPSSGFSRPLVVGTQLQPIGKIAQGEVLRPLNREIMIIGEDRSEAYPVAEGVTWNGYYLPYEKAFIPLKQPIPLQWTMP